MSGTGWQQWGLENEWMWKMDSAKLGEQLSSGVAKGCGSAWPLDGALIGGHLSPESPGYRKGQDRAKGRHTHLYQPELEQ